MRSRVWRVGVGHAVAHAEEGAKLGVLVALARHVYFIIALEHCHAPGIHPHLRVGRWLGMQVTESEY